MLSLCCYISNEASESFLSLNLTPADIVDNYCLEATLGRKTFIKRVEIVKIIMVNWDPLYYRLQDMFALGI